MGRKRSWNQKVVTVLGVDVKLFSTAYLADALGRTSQTVCRWERELILPKPIIETKDGRRWYTQEEVTLYARMLREEGVKNGVALNKFSSFAMKAKIEAKTLKKSLVKRLKKEGVENAQKQESKETERAKAKGRTGDPRGVSVPCPS